MEFFLTAMKLISPSVNMLTFLLRTLIVLSKVHIFKTVFNMNLTILLSKACIIIELCLKISHFCLARDAMHQHVQQLCTLSITFQSKLRFVFS